MDLIRILFQRAELGALPEDAVVQVRVEGSVVPPALGAVSLRALAPRTMNVSLTLPQSRR